MLLKAAGWHVCDAAAANIHAARVQPGARRLEYFDAYLVGLIATPGKQTFGFFHQNLEMEYNHEMAVADGVNYDVYRIKTAITEAGSRVEAGYYVENQGRDTRKARWEELDDDYAYDPNQLDRDVVTLRGMDPT